MSSQSQPGTQDGRKPEVPVVPFGMDLYYWDNPKDVEPMTLAPYVTHNNIIIYFCSFSHYKINLFRVGSLHRYWVQEREVNISEVCYIICLNNFFLQGLTMTACVCVCVIPLQEERARLRCRAITYAGEFEPVKRSCRAPLPNGTLCPRRDRVKVSYLMDNLCSFVWGSPVVACSIKMYY